MASRRFLLLLGDSSFREPGLLAIEVPDLLLSDDDLLVRSMFTKHVGVTDVLMVPLKIYDVLRWEDGRLHGRQVRPSATGMTGRNLQGFGCNLFYF